MRKTILSTLCMLLCIVSCLAQSAVKESLSFKSDLLHRDVNYSIYLPEDYNTSNRSYPVLYLLHGWTDNETSWIQMGDMKQIADETIESGEAVNMIIVMPDAKETWYVNAYDGKDPYEDMFFQELIPFIEKTYRARTNREFRAIAGLSMGGYGSFVYCMHHPELFSACAPLSAAVYTDEQVKQFTAKGRQDSLFDKIYGKGILTDHWQKNNVLKLLEDKTAKDFWHLQFYIDCGDKDKLLHGNYIIHEMMQAKDIKHEFRVRGGGHSWTYWRTALPTVLKVCSKQFKRS